MEGVVANVVAISVLFISTYVLCEVHFEIRCYTNGNEKKRRNHDTITGYKEGDASFNVTYEACIIGLIVKDLALGKQQIFIKATGTRLSRHYSRSQDCAEGAELKRTKKNEAYVKNFSCDREMYVVAYICWHEQKCNKKEKLPLIEDIRSNSTGSSYPSICPSQDFAMPEAEEGKSIMPRDYVMNCYITVDEKEEQIGALRSDEHSSLPMYEAFPARACIIGIVGGGKEYRKDSYFQQAAVVMETDCVEGLKALRDEEEKKRKEKRDEMIRKGRGTGDEGSINVGVLLHSVECENVLWEKAYICNYDACNVDDGCHDIPMQFTARKKSKRTCLPSPTCDQPKNPPKTDL